MAVARRRAVDHVRRERRHDRTHEQMAHDLRHGEEVTRHARGHAAADVPVVPPGAAAPGAGRAHVEAAWAGSARRRSPVVLPHRRAGRRPAHRRRQAHPRREPGGLRPARRRRDGAAPRVGAGGHLPDLQRGLLGGLRRRSDAPPPGPGGAAPGRHAGRARAGVGGAGAAGPDGDPDLTLGRPHRPLGRADPAARAEQGPLGPAADPPGLHRDVARPRGRRTARPLSRAGRDRRLPRAGALPPRRPTGRRSPRSTRSSCG